MSREKNDAAGGAGVKRRQPDLRHQIAALPLRRRRGGLTETCLITSRETRRWIIPKGWPIEGLDAAGTAAREAHEEAGLIGKVSKKPLASYRYWKRFETGWELIEVLVHEMKVKKHLPDWQEKGQRKRRWLPLETAAALITETELQEVLLRRVRPGDKR
jgi:8-oxo-dGTP pyrophosphatase MutT (NUDIX family)